MAFSGALTLTDLNDYLGPSQACIKPVSGKDAPDQTDNRIPGAASTEIAIDADGEYYEAPLQGGSSSSSQAALLGADKPRARTRLETAEISLNDCLACSGCVTSAESVLIGMQSVEELRKASAAKGTDGENAPTHIVASISPQTLASMSAKYSASLARPIPLHVVLRHIETFLRSTMKVDIVTDTTFARHLSLVEQEREYWERRSQNGGRNAVKTLPMLASACPGWICYAEKTHGELLPLISKTRSPQQMAGILAKRYLVEQGGIMADQRTRVYHVAVMPCYDKKLEASRQDFFDDLTQSRDVDLVITTGELDDLMQGHGVEWQNLAEADAPDASMTPPTSEMDLTYRPALPSLLQAPGSSSGSYMFDLMQRVWTRHVNTLPQNGGTVTPSPQLRVKVIRSADFTEYILRSPGPDGAVLFKGAQCYGFRNLQNLVRKVQKQTGLRSKKSGAAGLLDGPSTLGERRIGAGAGGLRGRGRGLVRTAGREGSPLDPSLAKTETDDEAVPYDFIEVMACPGGCVNGGGQIRPPGQANGTANSSSLTTRTIAVDMTEAMTDAAATTQVEDAKKAAVRSALDPEGYAVGWSTPPISVHSTADGASTPGDVSMDLDASDEAPVQGWKGTSKEWVQRVEYLYWRAAEAGLPHDRDTITNVHQAQAMGVPRDQVEAKIAAALSQGQGQQMDTLSQRILDNLCTSEQRSAMLRTQYRALQDEAVSGLAVQW